MSGRGGDQVTPTASDTPSGEGTAQNAEASQGGPAGDGTAADAQDATPAGNDTANDGRGSGGSVGVRPNPGPISYPLGRPALHQGRYDQQPAFHFPGFTESLADEMDLRYRMDHPRRGLALVFNHENFSLSVGMNRRVGTELDARNLRQNLTSLGFEVLLFQDLRVEEIKAKFLRAAQGTDHSSSDCFLCAFLTHGDDGIIYGYDGTLPLQDLFDTFRGDKCPSLVGKPKVFLVQACRGYKHEIGLETDSPEGDQTDARGYTVVNSGPRPTVPAGADMLICYSVTQGFYSHRDTALGSWFIQALSQVMERHAATVEFTTILTVVNRMVARRSVECCLDPNMLGKKQIPCFVSMLTKKLVFTPK